MSRSCVVFGLVVAAAFLGGCERPTEGPLPHRAYLWQRDWTPAVGAAFAQGASRLDGVVILGAEITWRGTRAEPVWADVEWARVAKLGKPFAVAMRVAPFGGRFAKDDVPARAVVETARKLLRGATSKGARLTELQIDFDCADKKLAGYREWLRALRGAIAPTRLVITTLPSWLNEREFGELLEEADGYVLQVHSVPTRRESGRTVLCDPALARQWVARAARYGKPFSVALPTYRCLAGFDPKSGRLAGSAMDSVQPVWPPGTHVLELTSDAEALAGLVREWQSARPAELREIIWYRLPVATDAFNWRWPTLAAVMGGRAPERRLEVITTGTNPVDVAVENVGEADEVLDGPVTVPWQGGPAQAGDALAGWTLELHENLATFSPPEGQRPRLPPGGKLNLGWLRHDYPTPVPREPLSR